MQFIACWVGAQFIAPVFYNITHSTYCMPHRRAPIGPLYDAQLLWDMGDVMRYGMDVLCDANITGVVTMGA